MKKCKLVVITPVYNLERYLKGFFDNLKKQSFQDFHLIIVDDCSSDGSLKVLKKYEQIMPEQITVIENDINKGAGASRDIGLVSEMAKGDYIMFLDADDYFEETYFEKMVNAIEQSNADLVVCGFDRVDEDTGQIYSKEMLNIKPERLTNLQKSEKVAFINPAPWNKIFNSKIITENVRFCFRTGEDLLFLLKAIPNLQEIYFLNELLYHYRIRKTSLMNTISKKNYDEFLNGLIDVKKTYESINKYEKYKNILDLIAFIHLGISYTYRLASNKNMNRRQVIRTTKENLNTYFPGWRTNPYLNFSHSIKKGIKGIGLWGCCLLYKLNMFGIFVGLYTFLINHLKIDIKW